MNHKFVLSFAVLFAASSSFADDVGEYAPNDLEGLAADASYFKNDSQYNAQSPQNGAPCFNQGEPLCREYPPAYNARAAIAVNGVGYCWDLGLYVDASFLYWHAGEEGLAIAYNGLLNSGTSYFPTTTQYHYQSFDYKPGFKAGFGFVTNRQWVWAAEYTWLRGHTTSHFSPSSTTTTAGTSTPLSGTPVLLSADWFLLSSAPYSDVKSTWKYGVDLVDATLSRPFYQGRRLTVDPSVGLRAAWIRQNMHVTNTEAAGVTAGTVGTPGLTIDSHNHSNSWGIGPRFGLGADYLIPWGFRFEGDLAGSLLFTQYTSISHAEDPASTAFNPGPYTISLHNYNCLRPMAEMGLGLGWGMYFCCQQLHIDFSASYDFTYMWSQNMMRKMLDDFSGSSHAAEDLYFHGLTVTGRFDF